MTVHPSLAGYIATHRKTTAVRSAVCCMSMQCMYERFSVSGLATGDVVLGHMKQPCEAIERTRMLFVIVQSDLRGAYSTCAYL